MKSTNPIIQAINTKLSGRLLYATLKFGLASLLALASAHTALSQARLESLETDLKAQYAEIERVIAAPPPMIENIVTWHTQLRQWQDELAQQFGKAASLVEEIIKLNPPQIEMWRERLETLRLYAQPISSPESRTIYGAGEVEKRAHVTNAPAAADTDKVRAAKANGDVRLRMVLAADGTVKYIFPIKSLDEVTTEAAIAAARQIRFEPAVRNNQPASQFVTFVYEFKQGRSSKPYIPRTVF
ncbi:MAG TPA: energy transducer TonB [Pyrinomonadaceae bacterium]|nr:energy transducer TonB [Pyrinomonadaceae bacterium]